ncbi:MAG: hypothetical protein ACLQGP_22795 [Isosphaeraceae bacterium]
MLAPLITNLLMACTLFLLAGWASDVIGRWSSAGRHSEGSAVAGTPGQWMRINHRHAKLVIHRLAKDGVWACDPQ